MSVVVVNWNGKQYLEECLGALVGQAYPAIEIVLVDNGSTDGSLALVAQRFPSVRVIALGRNTGFVGGNNAGIAATSGEVVLLVNNDTRALPGMISSFVQALEAQPRLGAVQGKIRLMREPERLDAGIGSFFTTTGFLRHVGHMQLASRFMRRETVFAGKGACLCLRRSALAATGLFDPAFFAYFEDADLCWRIWLAGYSVAFLPEAQMLHAVGGSVARAVDRRGFDTINFHSFKNRIRALIKNLGPLRLALVLPIHLLICSALMLVFALGGKAFVARGIARAMLWNARHLAGTLRERRRVQRRVRRVPDADVFRHTRAPIPIDQFLDVFRTYAGGLWVGRPGGAEEPS